MSKYAPLRRHLSEAAPEPVTMTFGEIDRLVGGLPASAATYRQWWANHARPGSPQSSWLDAGRRVVEVDLAGQRVTFGIRSTSPLAPTQRVPARPAGSAAAESAPPAGIGAAQVRALEAFLAFRRNSNELRLHIAGVEAAVVGLNAEAAITASGGLGVHPELLEGARLVKALSAQVDVVLHAAGIIHALPHVLEPDEVVQSVSLGAGNTGRAYDLETNLQVAEFKFIQWAGGAESVRQDNLLIDLFHLATADTVKRRVMYVTGASVPLRWLSASRRLTRESLARKARVKERFDDFYGPEAHRHVCDYWAAIRNRVELVDLTPLVPGLSRTAAGEMPS